MIAVREGMNMSRLYGLDPKILAGIMNVSTGMPYKNRTSSLLLSRIRRTAHLCYIPVTSLVCCTAISHYQTFRYVEFPLLRGKLD